jgi:hypothetical protein
VGCFGLYGFLFIEMCSSQVIKVKVLLVILGLVFLDYGTINYLYGWADRAIIESEQLHGKQKTKLVHLQVEVEL